ALSLPVLMPSRRHVRVYASSGDAFPEGVIDFPKELLKPDDWEYDIVPDLQGVPAERDLPPTRLGYRSSLRVPILPAGRSGGGPASLPGPPPPNKPAAPPRARRIADGLALSLSREKRREATERAEAAAARASELESRVKTLTEELSARAGYR